MENLTHALYMAFAVMTFVIAFSVSLYLVNKMDTTAKSLVYTLDESNYYDTYSLKDIIKENDEEKNSKSRVVGIDTIIPTLYRYYKESFSVKILNKAGDILQYFDTTTEGDINSYSTSIDTGELDGEKKAERDRKKALATLYGEGKTANMFGAPWLANINNDAKSRVDMYINGTKGYINNSWVDYSSNNLNQYKNDKFKEIYTQYAYEGDTVQDENDDWVTLTGSKQVTTKIIIIYQQL